MRTMLGVGLGSCSGYCAGAAADKIIVSDSKFMEGFPSPKRLVMEFSFQQLPNSSGTPAADLRQIHCLAGRSMRKRTDVAALSKMAGNCN
jgi:hypothetical protein